MAVVGSVTIGTLPVAAGTAALDEHGSVSRLGQALMVSPY